MAYKDIEKKRRTKLAWRRKWRKANPEKARAESRRYYRAQRAKALAYQRRWRAANREKPVQYTRKWQRANPEKVRAMEAARRAQKVAAKVPLSVEEKRAVLAIYSKARDLARLTGYAYHVDHIKPLSKGGLHHPSNLQVLRGEDNMSKGAKWQE